MYGGVHWWRGVWLARHADVYPAMTDGGFEHPAVDYGGARPGPPKATAPALSLPLSYPTRTCTRTFFSFKKIWEIGNVALSFVFDKYCPIMD